MVFVSEQISWTRKSLEDLVAFYWEEIAPELRAVGIDPESERPTSPQLSEVGFSGIRYTLRNHHGKTLSEFLRDDVGIKDDRDQTDYEWGIDARETIETAEKFLQRYHRKERAQTTIDSYRSKLATYLRKYAAVNGDADFLPRLQQQTEQPHETENVIEAASALRAHLGTDSSLDSTVTVIEMYYQMLEDRGYAVYNPATVIRKEIKIDVDKQSDQPGLVASQVKQLAKAATDTEQRLLVVAACAWGLRRSEIASLHISQFVQTGEDPHITFDDNRKNGPGTVALIYGVDTFEERIEGLDEVEGWNGYLFPSTREAGYVQPDTITNRFTRLSEQAGVAVDGNPATPHSGRRYWYREFSRAVQEITEHVELIADEQGSSDEQVVLESYLDESTRRALRRAHMRERLADAFEHLDS